MPLLHHSFVRGTAGASHRLLVLHGIYGQGRNWASVANALVQMRPEWEVVLADLREHGRSRGFPPPHDITSAAADVAALARSVGGAAAILGHSFGGKVALAATANLECEQAWIADSDPGARPPDGDAWEMLGILRSLPHEWPARERFAAALLERGLEPAVAGWMATNLERADGGYRLALDLDAHESLLRDYFASDLWPRVDALGPRAHAIRAMRSRVVTPDVASRFTAARAEVHELDAGHWMNADAPGAVAALLAATLPR